MPKGSARCRANQAYTALHRGEGVLGFGKDAEMERPKACLLYTSQAIELMYELKKCGLDVPDDIIDEDECAQVLRCV